MSAIAPAPTSGGSNAATRPRKTQNESRRTSGNAISSARRRSRWIALGHLARGDRAAAEAHLRIAGERREEPVGRLPSRRRRRGRAGRRARPRSRRRPSARPRVAIDSGSRRSTTAGPPVTSARTPGSASTPVLRSTSRLASAALGREVRELGRAGLHARDHGAADREGGDEHGSGDERDERSPGRDQVQKGSRHAATEAAMARVAAHASVATRATAAMDQPASVDRRRAPPSPSSAACGRPGSRTLRRRRGRRRRRRSRAPASSRRRTSGRSRSRRSARRPRPARRRRRRRRARGSRCWRPMPGPPPRA